MAKLILVSGDEPREFELQEFNSLGRHPNNTIQILDRIISKEHVHIVRTPDAQYMLKDLGSLNGTFIGQDRVKDQVLHDGDEINLGSTRLIYRSDEVDQSEVPLQKVTIAPGMMQSHIRQRLEAKDQNFLPEREVFDQEALRRDYERLRIAYELGRAVGNELDLDRLLHKVLDKSFEMLAADRGVVLLVAEDGQLLPRVAKQRQGGSTDEIMISNSIINEVIQNKQAVLSSDATVDSRFSGAHSIIMQGIRSTMSVPLLHGNDLLGIMHLDSQIATNAFDEKDLLVFTGIGSQAAAAIQNARLAAKIEWEARTRAQFQRFFSPSMVQQMIEGKLKLDGVGESREVTVMFADIRGFTAMTEKSNAHDVVELLNNYFEAMVEVLFRYDGTLDKYVGDEIMALFGVPVSQEGASVAAVECAVEMMKTLETFNTERARYGQPPVEIGIGMNTGICVYGALGSSKTLQYTVIGDAVNIASRLCSVARPGEIIISDVTYNEVHHHIDAEALPPVRVKGKEQELSIYRVLGVKHAYTPNTNTNPGPSSTRP
ncbi:MAG: GAF domain-containing protein [Deltaproteobacteria bacterium]|nr:GAF domain-containing protein [Deltaproteobacteria bacterium]